MMTRQTRTKLNPLHWTVDRVKQELPLVNVKLGKNIVTGRVSGRLNKFATVSCGFSQFKSIQLGNGWIDYSFAWETIVHSLNTGNPLKV